MPLQAGNATTPRLRAGGAAVTHRRTAAAAVARLRAGGASSPRQGGASAFGGVFGTGFGGAVYDLGIYDVDTYEGDGGHLVADRLPAGVAVVR